MGLFLIPNCSLCWRSDSTSRGAFWKGNFFIFLFWAVYVYECLYSSLTVLWLSVDFWVRKAPPKDARGTFPTAFCLHCVHWLFMFWFLTLPGNCFFLLEIRTSVSLTTRNFFSFWKQPYFIAQASLKLGILCLSRDGLSLCAMVPGFC